MKTSIVAMAMVVAFGLVALPGTAEEPDARDSTTVYGTERPVKNSPDGIPIGVQHETSCGSFATGLDDSCTTELPGVHCCILVPSITVEDGFTGRVILFAESDTGTLRESCFFQMAGVLSPDCDDSETTGAFYFGQTIKVTGTATAIPVGGWEVGLGNF